MNLSVKRVEVHGLHGRIDLELDLHPDVNILYGRNGSGKTTLLHIIANILSGSLDRFIYLQFQDVSLELSDGSDISLVRPENVGPKENWLISVLLNNQEITRINPILAREVDLPISQNVTAARYFPLSSPSLTLREALAEQRHIRQVAQTLPGEGAAYFPAFRTMIEAWRSADSRDHDFRLYIPEPPANSPFEDSEESRLTRLARELFGRFVPEIDYPSVIEIEHRLSDEIQSTEYAVATLTEDLLSAAFVDAFAALSESGTSPVEDRIRNSTDSPDAVLERIEILVKTLNESQIADVSETRQVLVPQQLREHLPRLATTGQSDTGLRVLSVYRDFLEKQLEVQRLAFARIKSYIGSVNEFLEGKRVVISRSTDDRHEPKVQIEFDDGSRESLKVLSSGERQVVSMLFAASSSTMERSSVVLIDEPEISLHIDWQRLLIKRMVEQLGGRQLVVCTHSPEIGADYEDRYQEVKPTRPRVTA
jgi:ABC-type lipoprotein export system ATPase subunit